MSIFLKSKYLSVVRNIRYYFYGAGLHECNPAFFCENMEYHVKFFEFKKSML